MGVTRHANAHWEGDLKTGQGRLDTPQSGLMEATRYGFNSRFGDQKGTNPEELIAAAHAGCFAMALSAQLTEAGFPPAAVDVRAEVELSMDGGPHISQIRLKLKASVPGLDEARFQEVAEATKQGCPISKALASVPISLESEFQG